MLILHIGASRTATTALQRNLFPSAKKHVFITKRPFVSSAGKWAGQKLNVEDLVQDADRLIATQELDAAKEGPDVILPLMFFASLHGARHPVLRTTFAKLLRHLLRTLPAPLCISSEMLSETQASLDCLSRSDWEGFPLYPLCSLVQESLGIPPAILCCLRDPIPHLVSKYLRCVVQRKRLGLRSLAPSEYIDKQVALDRSQASSSALAPVIHARFLQELHRVSYVKAVGFRDLLQSEDVFSTLGFSGEGKVPFRSLPSENKSEVSSSRRAEIADEITTSLKRNNYLELVMDSKMYI